MSYARASNQLNPGEETMVLNYDDDLTTASNNSRPATTTTGTSSYHQAAVDDAPGMKKVTRAPSWQSRPTRGLFLKKHKDVDEEYESLQTTKPKNFSQSVQNYFLSFLPQHVRKRGFHPPPCKVRIDWMDGGAVVHIVVVVVV